MTLFNHRQDAATGTLARDVAMVGASKMAPHGLHLLASPPCVAPPTLYQRRYCETDGLPLLIDITTRSLPLSHHLLHLLREAVSWESHQESPMRCNWSLLPTAWWVSLEVGHPVSINPSKTCPGQQLDCNFMGDFELELKLCEIMFVI